MRTNALAVASVIAGCAGADGPAPAPRAVTAARGAPAIVPLPDEPPATIAIEPPLAGPLSRGQVVIRHHTRHLHIAPVFGPAALAVSPRLGHVHVKVDALPWVWADASGDDLIIDGLPPGRHTVSVELVDANHRPLDRGSVDLTVPAAAPATPAAGAAPVAPAVEGPAARLVVALPLAEPLARGVVLLRYRADNVHLLPVFGPAARGVAPRIGHVHVSVDAAPWYWTDASGEPVIVAGLAPGRHQIRIVLVDADHRPLDQAVVEVDVPVAMAYPAHHGRAGDQRGCGAGRVGRRAASACTAATWTAVPSR
jgi:hypothetical protein